MKKCIIILLSAVLLFSVLPVSVLAEQTEDIMLSYDDRYAFDGYKIVAIKNETVTSYKVGYNIAVNHTKDEHVLTVEKDGNRVIAAGVGTATVVLSDGKRTIEKRVKVQPAKISVFLVLGQSNGEGHVDFGTDSVQTDYTQSIANVDGTAYSTYAPSRPWMGEMNTGFIFPEGLSAKNGGDFVAASLTGNVNVKGKALVYGINGITDSGNGKYGIDSALAYEWFRQTGEKCWVINTSHSGTSIKAWDPSDKTKSNEFWQTVAVAENAIATLEKEIIAGHYTLQHGAYFWFQGEADKPLNRDEYVKRFVAMHKALQKELQIQINGVQKTLLETCGLIVPRVCNTSASTTSYEDIAMNGPRTAQYYMASASDPEMKNIFIASNIGDRWVTDNDGSELTYMQDWFEKYYPDGVLTYPTQNGKAPQIPNFAWEIHYKAHYSQVGYNEIGRDSARSLAYAFGYSDTVLNGQTPEIHLLQSNGYQEYNRIVTVDPDSGIDMQLEIVPVLSPSCLTAKDSLQVSVDSPNLQYDKTTLTVKGAGTITFQLENGVTKSIQFKTGLFGDVNGDGKYNAIDSMYIRMIVAELDTPSNQMNYAMADVTGDGKYTGADVMYVRRLVAELITEKDLPAMR